MFDSVIGGNAFYMQHTDSIQVETRFKFNWKICDHELSNGKKLQTIV